MYGDAALRVKDTLTLAVVLDHTQTGTQSLHQLQPHPKYPWCSF